MSDAYRPDIDGLRAVAVGAVVLFHFGQVPGGYVGVDIFFVISGFLITQVLSRDIEAGAFSVSKFYEHRLRRILPALAVVIIATLVIGCFVLLPPDFEALGWQSAFASVGAANIYFLAHAGYFDRAAELLPLLHTWSLGVEEQFYLLWPIMLFGLWKLTRGSTLVIVLVLLLILASSLIALSVTVEIDPAIAFYAPQTRAWELAFGALASFTPRIQTRVSADMLRAVGILLIAWSISQFNDKTLGPALTLPCLGAVLLIWPVAGPNFISDMLSARPLVFVGKRSYSLYLWHWPILVYFRLLSDRPPSSIESVGLIVLCAVLADLSWRFVEQPWRRQGAKLVFSGAAASTALVIGLSAAVVVTTGLPQRLPEAARM